MSRHKTSWDAEDLNALADDVDTLQQSPGGGSVPQGWTDDGANPASVTTNGATITVDDPNNTNSILLGSSGVSVGDTTDSIITTIWSDDAARCIETTPYGGAVAIEVHESNVPAGVIKTNGVALFDAGSQVEVPAVPTPQDVVDALVALGIVTQAAP